MVQWQGFTSRLLDAGFRILGAKAHKNEDWFDDNNELITEALKNHRNLLRQQERNRANTQTENFIKQKSSELRKLTRDMKDKWWLKKAEYIQWLADTKQLGAFYGEVRQLIGTCHRVNVPIKSRDGSECLSSKDEVLARWAQHFNELLNLDRSADMEYIISMSALPTAIGLDEPPSLKEVRLAMLQLKNKKAVGIDNIPGELLKYGGERLHEVMVYFFVSMWNEEWVPDTFKLSRISALYKNKGDRSDCNSHRGISLLSTPGKVFTRILLNRLIPISEAILPETQFGFRPERGTCEAIFCVRQIQEKSKD